MEFSDIGSISHELEEAIKQIGERCDQGVIMKKEIQAVREGWQEEDKKEGRMNQRRQDESKKVNRPSLIHPQDAYLAAFFVPVLVLVIIYIQRQIFPFGEESFLRTDMYHQYAPFFSEFQYKLSNGSSLLYSWNIIMGV